MRRKTKRSRPAYLDASLDVEARVRDLLARMTLEEKIRQMTMGAMQPLLEGKRISPELMKKHFGNMGIGCLQDLRDEPKVNIEAVNAAQRYFVEKTRLGIPAMVISECLHGHVSGDATVFPQAIALGSTWNPALVKKMAQCAAKEARAVGVAQALAPDLDLARDPRWGRVEETYGEDPYLGSRMAVAYVTGMQGEGPAIDQEHLVCTPKHYAAHGSPEGGLNLAPVAGGMRELRTVYLPPFKAAVTEAGALSIMPAYSEYEGVPASASKLLLTRILREEWGFKGYVFSDYGAIELLHSLHKTAATREEAGKQAVEAGMDLEAPHVFAFGEHLLGLVRKGEVAEELINRAVTRILRVKFLAGLFENPYADPQKAARVINCPEHRRLARQIAQEAIILLKNEGKLLPLKPDIRSIAVIGPNADFVQLGDYSKPNCTPKSNVVSPLNGIRRAVSKGTQVRYARGCELAGSLTAGFEEAIEAARESDVAVVVIGGTSTGDGGICEGSPEPIATCGEGYDRADLNPPGMQEDLVRAIHATGTPTIVVMVHGRPYSIPWMAENIPAIIEAWYPGDEGGTALADILFGKVNPSGRLTVSVPRSVGHLPAFYNHKPSAQGNHRRAVWGDKSTWNYVFASPTTPLFEFGHGLSYTTFRYTNLRVSPGRILPGARVTVTVDVQNTGKVAGKEVVQLYVNDVASSVTTPVEALKRFEKVSLSPGQRKTVTFELGPDDLALLDENMNWVVEPGEFEVMVGGKKKAFKVVRA